ncbi:MAG: substrate-binding domain-containing protein [Thermaerobacter sp.]|nr:substrate-binding domain-containing protein [Thermaerobacter sp.]
MMRLRLIPALAAACSLGLLSACGSDSSPGTSSASPVGIAQVAYAGSLESLNEETLGPAFHQASGYRYQGRGGGSIGLAQEILSKTIAPNVFESIGYAPIHLLEPKYTSWALAFASSPLVVAYNPQSRYAPQLNAIRSGKVPLSHLFTLMAEPGFHLGRTNPNTDPQGQAFWWMVQLAVRQYHLPAGTAARILGAVNNSQQIFSEEGILTNLQSGGLDAASAFLPEALSRHLAYIALPARLNFSDPHDASWYRQASVVLANGQTVDGSPLTVDITTVGTPSPASLSFIRYVISRSGQRLMRAAGYTVFAPVAKGDIAAIPSAVRP